jgi:hypothetical protein
MKCSPTPSDAKQEADVATQMGKDSADELQNRQTWQGTAGSFKPNSEKPSTAGRRSSWNRTVKREQIRRQRNASLEAEEQRKRSRGVEENESSLNEALSCKTAAPENKLI